MGAGAGGFVRDRRTRREAERVTSVPSVPGRFEELADELVLVVESCPYCNEAHTHLVEEGIKGVSDKGLLFRPPCPATVRTPPPPFNGYTIRVRRERPDERMEA
jgi:hypothetical protein